MNNLVYGKKILILGSNPETITLVDTANRLGVFTYVMDPFENSPAKKNAHCKIDSDAMNIDNILFYFDQYDIDGIMVGVADVLIPKYEEACRLRSIPCYANEKAVDTLCFKDNFLKYCKKFDIDIIPSFQFNNFGDLNFNEIEFPVVIKPVDSAAGKGLSVCSNRSHVEKAITHASVHSLSQKLVCEKFMTGNDVQAYYTIINSNFYLSSLVDRKTNKSQGNYSPVCIGANYNSNFKDIFVKKIDSKIKSMLSSLNITNGVFSLQCFIENEKIYPYDPGFRLQGEGQHLILKSINGFDHSEMLVNFALTGEMGESNFDNKNNIDLHGKRACSVWVLLYPGKIKNIYGLDEIKSMDSYLDILQRFDVGSVISEQMIGTERQVFARIYLASSSTSELIESINFLHKNLKILDQNNQNMIIDYFNL